MAVTLPYIGLEEVTKDKTGLVKAAVAEFLGTMFLVNMVCEDDMSCSIPIRRMTSRVVNLVLIYFSVNIICFMSLGPSQFSFCLDIYPNNFKLMIDGKYNARNIVSLFER